MNAKNYLTNVHIPQEDKSVSYSFLLQYRIHFHLLYSPLNSAWHTVGIQTFVEIIYHWLYLRGRGKLGGETRTVLNANVQICMNEVLHPPTIWKSHKDMSRGQGVWTFPYWRWQESENLHWPLRCHSGALNLFIQKEGKSASLCSLGARRRLWPREKASQILSQGDDKRILLSKQKTPFVKAVSNIQDLYKSFYFSGRS